MSNFCIMRMDMMFHFRGDIIVLALLIKVQSPKIMVHGKHYLGSMLPI